MISLYKMSRKRILALFALSILVIATIANIGTHIVNNYYANQLIHNEDQKFVSIFSHTIEYENEIEGLKYASHYTHIYDVGIIISSGDEVLFKSKEIPVKIEQYEVEVKNKVYQITIDSSQNSVLIINKQQAFIINIIVIASTVLLLLYVVISRRIKNKRVIDDITKIEHLMKNKTELVDDLNYIELQDIFKGFYNKIKEVDLMEEKRKDNLNGLIHDLKTPITILLNHLDDLNTLEDLIHNKDAIKRSLEDLSSTASDLISENFMGVKKRFLLSVNLEKELQNYISTFKSKDITLKYDITKNIVVEWNKRDFGRVLRNLLTNAFYYSDSGTEVFVTLLNEKNKYVLKIVNTGKGIKDSDLARIFEKNTRTSEEDNSEGNGIGLYITKLLVEEIGAIIYAESKEDKNTFTIEIKKQIS